MTTSETPASVSLRAPLQQSPSSPPPPSPSSPPPTPNPSPRPSSPTLLSITIHLRIATTCTTTQPPLHVLINHNSIFRLAPLFLERKSAGLLHLCGVWTRHSSLFSLPEARPLMVNLSESLLIHFWLIVCLFVCLSVKLSTFLFIYLSSCLPIRLCSIRVFICLCF